MLILFLHCDTRFNIFFNPNGGVHAEGVLEGEHLRGREFMNLFYMVTRYFFFLIPEGEKKWLSEKQK